MSGSDTAAGTVVSRVLTQLEDLAAVGVATERLAVRQDLYVGLLSSLDQPAGGVVGNGCLRSEPALRILCEDRSYCGSEGARHHTRLRESGQWQIAEDPNEQLGRQLQHLTREVERGEHTRAHAGGSPA